MKKNHPIRKKKVSNKKPSEKLIPSNESLQGEQPQQSQDLLATFVNALEWVNKNEEGDKPRSAEPDISAEEVNQRSRKDNRLRS